MTASVRRVTITGSECVGKTTLATALSQHYGVHVSTEFVREYALRHPHGITARDHAPIAAGQIAVEDAALMAAQQDRHRLLICDTDLLSTVAYAHHYTGQCDPAIERMARERLGHLYLLLDIDVPWVPDGIRDQPHQRAEAQARFVWTLQRMAAPYVTIRGTWDDRLRQAIEAIDHLLAT